MVAKEPFNEQTFLARLEDLGLPRVKVMLENDKFSTLNNKRQIAQEWFFRKELERADASNAEQMRVALSAKRAAWTAASTAIVAAIITAIGTAIVIVLNRHEIWSFFFGDPSS